jgi:diphosphomevalonate decarboxylase
LKKPLKNNFPLKATVQASSDLALVKYWGKKDPILRLPENGSISMILEGLKTTTTVEFSKDYDSDQLIIQNQLINQNSRDSKRVSKQLDRVRALAKEYKLFGSDFFAKVVSQNNFPKGTGLSSSGSGMSALTLASTHALNLKLSEKDLSILARQASGTACRCVCGGFVEWLDGNNSETSYSETIFSAKHWDIRDIITIVDEGQKKISSTKGHESAQSSPFYQVRQSRIKEKINAVKLAIKHKDFTTLGKIVEAEALEFHSILLTSKTPLIMWYPGTIQVMQEVQTLRTEGIECYFTINTGFNVHVLTLPKFEQTVQQRLNALSLVQKTLNSRVGEKPKILNEHLF